MEMLMVGNHADPVFVICPVLNGIVLLLKEPVCKLGALLNLTLQSDAQVVVVAKRSTWPQAGCGPAWTTVIYLETEQYKNS